MAFMTPLRRSVEKITSCSWCVQRITSVSRSSSFFRRDSSSTAASTCSIGMSESTHRNAEIGTAAASAYRTQRECATCVVLNEIQRETTRESGTGGAAASRLWGRRQQRGHVIATFTAKRLLRDCYRTAYKKQNVQNSTPSICVAATQRRSSKNQRSTPMQRTRRQTLQ